MLHTHKKTLYFKFAKKNILNSKLFVASLKLESKSTIFIFRCSNEQECLKSYLRLTRC